jgi:iron complex outermembrane receptor protein
MVIMLCSAYISIAQNTLTARILDASSNEPLTGASVLLSGTGRGVKADSNGLAILSQVPDGKQLFSFHFIGYKEQVESLRFPR